MNKAPILAIVLALAIAIPPSGVTAGSSQLIHNPEMSKLLAAGNPPDGLRWYTTGRESIPDAIIGLTPPWRQGAKFWREVDPESEDTGMLVQDVAKYRGRPPQALDIVGPDGKVIGVYWSSIYWTIIRMGGDGEIRVFRPTPPPLP